MGQHHFTLAPQQPAGSALVGTAAAVRTAVQHGLAQRGRGGGDLAEGFGLQQLGVHALAQRRCVAGGLHLAGQWRGQAGATGGGFGLACAADVALADESARFGLPETSLGVIPAQIAPFLVERLGYAEAKRLALLGGRISAEEARTLGLVHGVYTPGAALGAALEAPLDRLFACAPAPPRATGAAAVRDDA